MGCRAADRQVGAQSGFGGVGLLIGKLVLRAVLLGGGRDRLIGKLVLRAVLCVFVCVCVGGVTG